MKNNLTILFLTILILLGCKNEKKIDYKKIDEKIKCYENATALYKFISEDRNEDYQKEVFEAINKFIINLDYMTNNLMNDSLNEKERDEDIKTLNRFVNNNTKKCVKTLGEYELKPSQDSNYFYEMKIKYIECILNTSNCIDSVNLICNKTNRWHLLKGRKEYGK